MFDKRLKLLRNEKDLKQSELADILGVSNSTIGMYEQGRRYPDLDTLQKIADYFDVSVDYLLGRTDIRKFEDFPEEVQRVTNLIGKIGESKLIALEKFIRDFLEK